MLSLASHSPQNITVPSLVIHGAFDPLLVLEHGVATHKAIPGSSFLKIDTMGHDLPEKHWGDIVGAIHEVAAKGVVAAGGSNKSTVGDAGKTESGTDAVAKEVQPEVKTVQNSKIGENGSGSSMPEGPGRVVVTAQAI
ncbi:hypothetical protein SARC_14718 [Sphaeroforma arctica JP610]|uniref:Peptidase S33 tripeptidyl aminopeptidase-like C-terminal domain-containing protein n=1 Tax=Sphaeroforma arctica JP610 TaxID=667725 RepID=A0A0L0F7Q6_9EUKA|nr:hypothetical protein SARC_14718 [Sphaeroforma arctica JP610]KNC72719.1 hypothetical protein SARC_14718 [Sphaeroforma arctica JP610]|eukprot:XP_014146621.1 hypothetical protein SARC_14718 [Sphaeroforma arctica JP610]